MVSGVETFDGYVARFMGDGLLALFGAPQAMEHHVEQAIRAGLDIQRRMTGYSTDVKTKYGLPHFAVRVGINTGYLVASLVAGGKGEYTVIGDPINIASRLEEAAQQAITQSIVDNLQDDELTQGMAVRRASRPG
jgi:adenylate cyclase